MQGQSLYTSFKQERFSPVLAQSLRISKASSVARFPYYHVDLNAGGGYNHEVDVQGSPLNFLAAVARTQRDNVHAFFIDQAASCIEELIAQPALASFPSDRLAIFHGDNAEVLPVVDEYVAAHERRPWHAMGSILVDPNGYHDGVPWDALRTFCEAHPRFDLFFNLNVRSFRMERAHIIAKTSPAWERKRLQPLSAFAEWFHRPHWMWTEPIQLAGNTWIQGVGRTMPTLAAGYASLGFYDSQSDRGRSIVDAFDGTTKDSAQFRLLWDV